MNLSLKPNPLIAVWLPGFAAVLAIMFVDQKESPFVGQIPDIGPTLNLIALAVFGFVIGNFLDAVRDALEWAFDRLQPINWNFFVSGSKEQLGNLEEWFYTWYELDMNLLLGILLFIILRWRSMSTEGYLPILGLVIFFISLSVSAAMMRSEVKRQIDRIYHD